MADVFRFNGTGFERIPGSLRQISAGTADAVWGVNDQDQLFRFNTASRVFDQVQVASDIASVSVGQTGEAWMVTTDLEIIRLNSITGSLEDIPGELRQIAAASGGFAWGLDRESNVFLLENAISKQIPGTLQNIATGPTGNAWGLAANSSIFFSDPDTSQLRPVPGSLSSICVGEFFPVDNVVQVWGLNPRPRPPGNLIQEHDIFRLVRHPDGTTAGALEFVLVPGELMVIAAAAEDVWGINAFHDVFRWNPQRGAFDPIPGQQLDAISVGNGTVWGLSAPFTPPR
jgi:hypothetical protein